MKKIGKTAMTRTELSLRYRNNNNLTHFGTKLDKDLKDRFDKYLADNGMQKTEWVRQKIKEQIKGV